MWLKPFGFLVCFWDPVSPGIDPGGDHSSELRKTAMAVHDHPDRCVLIETQSALATSSAWKVFGCDGTTEVGVPCEIIDLARPSHRPRLIVRRIEELSLIALQAAEEIALDWMAQVQDVVGPLMPRMGAVEQEQASEQLNDSRVCYTCA